MTFDKISSCYPVNDITSPKLVDDLVQSMLADGWIGCPMLILNDNLLTGSHRLAALKRISAMYDNGEIDDYPEVLEQDVAEDVSEEVNERLSARNLYYYGDEETGDIDYTEIGWMLKGTWVEAYKDEIVEWGNDTAYNEAFEDEDEED